ncbi:unnamed protein product [Arctia plantaginis]|uniref:Protease inhibitor n=1 Tax=Arctia plantaginis TaxID=874455 RepID=A0A8S0ZNG1_ARCPL|nr:unnamed protein product [Arctia plantaginis]
MKFAIALCILAIIAMSSAKPQEHSRGCIYILGKCQTECEEGTHAYATACGKKTPEATCDEPNPKPETADICDYSACYCDEPTVRDTASGKCVTLDKCPQK